MFSKNPLLRVSVVLCTDDGNENMGEIEVDNLEAPYIDVIESVDCHPVVLLDTQINIQYNVKRFNIERFKKSDGFINVIRVETKDDFNKFFKKLIIRK